LWTSRLSSEKNESPEEILHNSEILSTGELDRILSQTFTQFLKIYQKTMETALNTK